MAHCVHIHVCFACDDNDVVAALATKHRPAIVAVLDDKRCFEANWFLEDLAKRTGANHGPKGGLSLWGMVGNYTSEDKFVEVLMPFWKDLLGIDGGPCSHEHVLIFFEREQTERTTAIEIFLEDDEETIAVKEHECPFTFMQF